MPVSEIARTFGVDWTHLAAQAVSFSIVCLLLYRFAYAPVLTMLDARRQQIAQGLANTEKINAELKQIDRERQDVMAAALLRDEVEARREHLERDAARDPRARLGRQIMLRARDRRSRNERDGRSPPRRRATAVEPQAVAGGC
jgi:F-type H+-transporting ATPase subunit b